MATYIQQVASVRFSVQDQYVRNPLISKVAVTLIGIAFAPVIVIIEIEGKFHGESMHFRRISREALHCLRLLWTS